MSVMLSAAACLDWAARLTGLSLNELIESSLKADPRSDLLFLPYLAGERTPHANPNAQGVLFGLNSGTGAAEIARAVMEGVAMGLRDGLDVLTATGTEICEITMAGGGSRSDVWGKILADTLGRPLIWRNGGEIGPALGAARLAQMAAGAGTVGERCVAPEIVGRIEPDPALGQTLIERQQLFRSIYRSLAQYWEHA
jgi:xylulokinase